MVKNICLVPEDPVPEDELNMHIKKKIIYINKKMLKKISNVPEGKFNMYIKKNISSNLIQIIVKKTSPVPEDELINMYVKKKISHIS